jgi:serine/threonine protein phosphatase PrpC
MGAAKPFRSVCRTDCGRVRTVNQDAFFAQDDAGLWAVSDGMGGHAWGEIASAEVVTQLKLLVSSSSHPISKEDVERALLDANLSLQERSAASGLRLGMGATAAALCANGGRYFCLWVGDSRIYRLRDGALTLLTHDHRYVQELVDSGALAADAARIHPKRNVLTRAVGLEHELRIDACDGAFAHEDKFLIATDGVTGVCSDDEIASCLRHHDIDDAADRLVALCNEKGSPDNLALVLVQTP